MSQFVDSSALVKFFVAEPGSSSARSILDEGGTTAVVSAITRVEVPSALWKKQRIGEISETHAAQLVADFERMWLGAGGRIELVKVAADPTIARAARLSGIHGLRAIDALQLAAAERARRVHPNLRRFATFDEKLAAAAAREGFTVVGPAEWP